MSKKTIISVVVFIFTTVTLYSPLFSNAASANTVSEKIADIYQQLLILKTNLFTSDLAVDDSQFPLTQASGRQGIIAYTGAESGKIDITGCTGDDCWREEIHDNDPYHSQAVSAVKGLARSGDYSMRIYWGPDWPLRGGKIRSELKKPGELFLEAGNEYWIGFSTYMRDNANNRDVIATDYTNAHIMQWHWMDVNGTSGINIRKGRYHFSFGSLRPETNIAPVTLGQWEDWVMHVKVTNDNTGFVRVWLNADSVNDKPVYEKTNVKTLASGDSKLNQKIGIYRWYGAPEAKDHYYEHFYDEFRIGNKNASFDDVKPGDGGGSSGTVNTQNNSTNNNQGTTNTPNTTNTTTNTFAIGNRVKVSADGARLAIRDTDGTRLGAQNDGALGTIT
ncbi:polysaccharide lyase, partial [Candidatus Kaiserbacteria bacterium]|nr:polysaccharide lyase [Candidatus Kaiserbacteria bacterium]